MHFVNRSSGVAVIATVFASTVLMFNGSVAQATLIAADAFLTGSTPANGQYAITPTKIVPAGTGQNPTIAGFTGPWTGNIDPAEVQQWEVHLASINGPEATGGRARFAGF